MVYTEIIYNKYLIQIGRNREENDKLVRENHEDDLWFHLKGGPSPHGILSYIPKETLKEGERVKYSKTSIFRIASLIKDFSKYKNLNRVGIEYLPLKFVKPSYQEIGCVALQKNPKRIIV